MSSTVDRCTPPPNVTCTGIPIFYIRARRVDIPGRQTVLATGFTINPQTCGVTATSTQFTPWVECWRGFSPPQFVELVSVYF